MPLQTQLPDRFWAKVDQSGPCWLWTACTSDNGYPRFFLNGKKWAGHRLAYADRKGPIPEGLELDHLCRVRHCVNPDHLEAVTREVNVQRGLAPAAASRNITAYNHLRGQATHCKRDHEFTPENTKIRVTQDGYRLRECQACKRVRRGVAA